MLNSVDLREVWRDLDVLESELDSEATALEQAWLALCDLDTENTIAHDEIARADELMFIDRDAIMRIEVGRIRLTTQLYLSHQLIIPFS